MFAALTALVGVVILFGIGFWLTINNLLYICGPNEVLVFSGGSSTVNDNRVGYRIVKGGMSLRKPLVERVSRMDLTNMTVEVSVTNAYSRGGIPLTVSGVANLKVAGHQPLLHNALVRFEGRERDEIIQIAKDTLEGNLRGVLAKLTPEEVNDDKLAFAEQLLDEAETDLASIGLTLDQLKIQNVSDEASYLDSIGRRQTAEIQRRARTAEANNHAESVIQDAENRKAARIIEAEAQIKIVQAQTAKRIADAESRREALVAEEVGHVKAAIARAEAELKVQQARVEQVRRRLAADVLEPAKADMEASQAHAKGIAAKIIEDGKATADVLEEMIKTWQNGDESARDIFLMQKLQTVMSSLVDTIQGVQVDRLIILPDSNSNAAKSVRLVEELKAGIGVDIPEILNRIGRDSSDIKTDTISQSASAQSTPPAQENDNS
ncbi:MAG: SPFH domain-containing protein [Myxococcota bacterium]|nr:SPFH domain-containing protein [Myxococcota bacterium]